jgi:hypothetical protein
MQDIQSLALNILAGKRGTTAIKISDFRVLYRFLEQYSQNQNQKLGETYILLLTEEALVRFEINPKAILRVNDNHRSLEEKDFQIVISPKFEGNIKPIPLRAFIWTEIVQNWWIIVPTSIIFFFLFSKGRVNSSLPSINQMLVEANALFIGIFVLFTITQNRELLASRELIKNGTTHQLMQNDRFITWLAISSLLTAFLSSALVGAVSENSSQIRIIPELLVIDADLWSRVITTISLVLLTDCILAVTRYYLRVMRTALEGRMYLDIMGSKIDKDKGEEE